MKTETASTEEPGAKYEIQNLKGNYPKSTTTLLTAVWDLHCLGKLQTYINAALGPLILIDFAQLVSMTCGMGILPLKYFSQFQKFDALELFFLGTFLAFLFRLVVMTVCMGNVYPTGIEVNAVVSQVLLNSKDLSCAQASSVLGFLTVYSSNPILVSLLGIFSQLQGTLC